MKKSITTFFFLIVAVLAANAQLWNVSTLFTDGTLIDRDTTIGQVTLKADASSSSHKLAVSACSETLSEQTFTLRMKFDGGGNANYRHLCVAAQPGDTIRLYVSSASSSLSERTMRFYKNAYNGDEVGSFKAKGITCGEYVVEQPTATTIAVAASSSWYLYAIQVAHNPSYVYVAPEVHWYMKHPWGGGSWTWKELTPNADKTLYSIRDIYGSAGCNYSKNSDGSSSSWIEKPTLVGNPSTGDSAIFAFDPEAKSITITIIGEPKPLVQRWYLNHPWGGGSNWSWKELAPSATDSTIYFIRDVFGGNGFNYSQDKSGNAWISENNLEKVGSPIAGDSCLIEFYPADTRIVVTKLGGTSTNILTPSTTDAPVKFIHDGQLFIRQGQHIYTPTGKIIK